MGKPYRTELSRLSESYQWGCTLDIANIRLALGPYLSFPLVAVGSGGSLTTAYFAAAFHQSRSGRLARAMTPLEASAAPCDWRKLAVLFLTAGGGNPDVLGCFREIARREPAHLGVFCCRPKSALAREASRTRFVDQFLLDPPTGKDGFLATNTLLASAVVLARAYDAGIGSELPLPDDITGLAGHADEPELRDRYSPLWERNTLVVLHGPSTQPAAVDLESKFVEAALGDVHVADYRNFAHGRHQWLARRGQSTGVLALIAPGDADLADRTLNYLPPAVPVARIAVGGSFEEQSIGALVRGLEVAGFAGAARGIDPGSPKVSAFGRKLYHLNAYRTRTLPFPAAAGDVAVERKARCRLADLERLGLLGLWRQAFTNFCSALVRARFCGVVLDYDGTVCDPHDRFRGPDPAVMAQVARLLRLRVPVGIATGRGRSVGASLRETLPQAVWPLVKVGYYNGSDIAGLDELDRPDRDGAVAAPLDAISRELSGSPTITAGATLTVRPRQLTVEVAEPTLRPLVWATVAAAAKQHAGVLAVSSSHSFDVLAPGVTKLAVVDHIRKVAPTDGNVLCVGDRGDWPGNDFELMGQPHSLSADEPSFQPNSGWNLAPPGMRWSQATHYYLERLHKVRRGIRMRIDCQ